MSEERKLLPTPLFLPELLKADIENKSTTRMIMSKKKAFQMNTAFCNLGNVMNASIAS